MEFDIRARFELGRKILDQRPVKIALAIWTVVCVYDTLLSQVIPAAWSERFPKVRDIVIVTSGWLSFQEWLLILSAGFIAASLEYAFRKTTSPTITIQKTEIQPTVNNTNFTFITIGELLIYSAFGISGVVLSVYLFITVISLFEGPDPHINNPPKAARYNGDGSERRFAAPPPKNLRALVRPFNRMTSQDAKEIVQNYIGEWISLSGVISDISKFEDKRIVSLNYKTRSPSATLTFNTYWTKWIKAMHKKDKIWAVCRIREIYSSSIDLDPCEVASQSPEPISAPSPAQAQNGNGSSIASPVDSGQFENPKLIFPVPDWARRTGHLFVPIMSWDALTSPYHTLTTQEADKQTKPYLEDWVIISGVVEDVRLSDVFNAEIIHLTTKIIRVLICIFRTLGQISCLPERGKIYYLFVQYGV